MKIKNMLLRLSKYGYYRVQTDFYRRALQMKEKGNGHHGRILLDNARMSVNLGVGESNRGARLLGSC